jgi:glutamate 5-kinase
MASKVAAARMASWSGIATVIAAARNEQPLQRALSGQAGVGTHFLPRSERLTARETWIAFASPAKGTLTINDGAVEALRRHASLLRVGLVASNGTWLEGEAVAIVATSGEVIAKGLCRLSSAELAGGTESVLVHVDDLVVMP